MGYPLGKLKWVKGRPTSATRCFLTEEEVLAAKAVDEGTFVPSSNTISGRFYWKTFGYVWIPGTRCLTWALCIPLHPLPSKPETVPHALVPVYYRAAQLIPLTSATPPAVSPAGFSLHLK